ncbi:SDR family NAD(P)-dependent oxidoreductase [Billgrantia endophytica]|nr:SDR family oxidoreductase [Halomonas endophytica]
MRITVVVGAAGGIGSAIAEALLESGDFVYLFDLEASRGRLVSILDRWPDRSAFVSCDLASSTSIDQAFANVADESGRLDACVNAAGVIRRERFVDVNRHDLEAVMAVNVTGAYLALQAATRLMTANGGGRLVTIASAHGLRTTAERSSYAMSKGAILALTRALAVELGPQGILVNAVAPGPVSAGMQDAQSESRRLWQAATPLGRVAKASEVAQAAVFLASASNTFISGDTLIVDGGASAALGQPG